MDKDGNWIKLYRETLENPIVTKDADHLAVWTYLLLKTQYQPYDTLFGNKRITLQPGQLIVGRVSMSEFLKISESKIRRVLKLFKDDNMIEQTQKSGVGSLITILQYSKFQETKRKSIKKEVLKVDDKTAEKIFLLRGFFKDNFTSNISQSIIERNTAFLEKFSANELKKAFEEVGQSSFLMAKTGFKMNIQYFINHFDEILTGSYRDFEEIKENEKSDYSNERKEEMRKMLEELGR